MRSCNTCLKVSVCKNNAHMICSADTILRNFEIVSADVRKSEFKTALEMLISEYCDDYDT